MLRWFYTVLKIKRQCKKLVFFTFLLKNPTYTQHRVTKIGMDMNYDAYSVQIKNHENREIFMYRELEKMVKNSFFRQQANLFLVFCNLSLDI